MFGSMVQKGKLADWALALERQLKRVDFPTFGNPTIPAFILSIFLVCKYTAFHRFRSAPQGIIFPRQDPQPMASIKKPLCCSGSIGYSIPTV